MNESLPSQPLHILLKEYNQHALTVLNRDYSKGLYVALRFRYFTNDDDFHAVFNDALRRIWALHDRFDNAEDVVKTLFKITREKAIDRLRHLNTKAGRLLTGIEPDELEADNLEERIPLQELPLWEARVSLFRTAIDQLSDKQRVIIEALLLKGEPIRDLAQRLGLQYSTVTNTRDQALKKMRAYLLQHHITPDMVEQLAQFLTVLWLLFSTFFKNN